MPEIEAIATQVLMELEQQGQKVVPSAKAIVLTMDREGIRRLAAEELKLPTSEYQFVVTPILLQRQKNWVSLYC